MKHVIYGTIAAASILSCASKPKVQEKFKLTGEVNVLVKTHISWSEENVTGERRKAVAFTDTIHGYNQDSVWYWNTDGSKVTILKPYKIDTLIR